MSNSIPDLADVARSGVLNIILETHNQRVGSGTGFLTEKGLVTASHVLRERSFETVSFGFAESATGDPIRLSESEILGSITRESLKEEHDFAVLDINEPEFAGRHRFNLIGHRDIRIGQQVLFLGYPYESQNLATHVGYAASIHRSRDTRVLQLDGSVNPSNSGGPVIDIENGDVVAYITRAQTGLAEDFDSLVQTLDQNVTVLSQQRAARMTIGGIDPVSSLRATMAAMRQIAVNMRRSANVGIGYAYDAAHIVEALN